VSITVNQTVHVASEPEARPAPPLPWKESKKLILAFNASRKHPRPLCAGCSLPNDPREADEFDPRYCTGCGINRTEKRVRRLLRAKGRKARKRALRHLLALSPKK
jgi:hypothetical protein